MTFKQTIYIQWNLEITYPIGKMKKVRYIKVYLILRFYINQIEMILQHTTIDWKGLTLLIGSDRERAPGPKTASSVYRTSTD